MLPSSKIEDREEKADYFTVVVLRRLETGKRARAWNVKSSGNDDNERELLLLFCFVIAFQNGPF